MRVEIPNTVTVTIGGLISRGVKAAEVTDAGRLVFTLTDGSVMDLGAVMGPQGPKGETGARGEKGEGKGRKDVRSRPSVLQGQRRHDRLAREPHVLVRCEDGCGGHRGQAEIQNG